MALNMDINFEDLFAQLKQGVEQLAKESAKSYIKQANKDGQKILSMMEGDLKIWTAQLANKEMSKDDFKDLVLGQKDTFKMVALKNAGLAAIQTDRFKQGVFDLILNTLTSII